MVVLEVGEVLALCGWFVIASAANERQVKAICDEVELQIHDAGGPKPRRIEGLQDRLWVLMDYGDVVVHVFQQDQREFYDLERLWSDVPQRGLVGVRRVNAWRPAEAGLQVELMGLEPTAFCVPRRRSSQLSYSPEGGVSVRPLCHTPPIALAHGRRGAVRGRGESRARRRDRTCPRWVRRLHAVLQRAREG